MMKLAALFAFAAVFALAASQDAATDPMADAPSSTTTTDPNTTPKSTHTPTSEAPAVNTSTADTPTTEAPVISTSTDTPTTEAPVVNGTTTETLTTEAPAINGTTTDTPANDTTVAPGTTTQAPVPTTEAPLPDTPPTVNYTTNVSCIMMKMAARFNVSYKTAENKSMSVAFDLSTNTTWVENCGDKNVTGVQTLTGDTADYTFTLTFTTKDKDNYALSEMDLVFNIPASDESVTLKASNLTLYSANKKNSYMCNAKQSQKFDKSTSTVDLSNVQIQAFSSDPTKFNTAQECPADSKTSNIVPIAVGAALAALVVIVLIAYLISRSRNQTGYESV